MPKHLKKEFALILFGLCILAFGEITLGHEQVAAYGIALVKSGATLIVAIFALLVVLESVLWARDGVRDMHRKRASKDDSPSPPPAHH